MLHRLIRYFLDNQLIASLLVAAIVFGGLITAPFGWELGGLPSDPVPVDAIPNLGENQQIVFTRWPGQSPQDVQDQLTYPLTTTLLGVPGVKSVRSSSMFGFSMIYLIFKEDIDFYDSRTRILEQLNALPAGLLPPGVQPQLGPDATPLGQVFWYTLEGRDSTGTPTGGWDLDELRLLQDFHVKYALAATEGVSEVASVGGYVQEYQVDIDPAAMRAYGVGIRELARAVQAASRDAGAGTMEINRAEYYIRGLGEIESAEDLEQAVVKSVDHTPVRVADLARVKMGPAERRGALDKAGAEAVGGVVVAREGANPMEVIKRLKANIRELEPGLPSKTLADGRQSKVNIVPFYNRGNLIQRSLGTLEEALTLQVLITVIVILVMVVNLRASVAVASMLPLAILLTFIGMRYLGVQANVVALAGIAIAIGTMIDLGIVLSENLLAHRARNPEAGLLRIILTSTQEVSGALLAAVATTIVSFLPVFSLQGEEGKLFHPLAYTKTLALGAALVVSLLVVPSLLHLLFRLRINRRRWRQALTISLFPLGVILLWSLPLVGIAALLFGAGALANDWRGQQWPLLQHGPAAVAVLAAAWLLAREWLPLGPGRPLVLNVLFVLLLLGLILGSFRLVTVFYPRLLRWCLDHKGAFLVLPGLVLLGGLMAWQGFGTIVGPAAEGLARLGADPRQTSGWTTLEETFPGLGEEFMPSLEEGAFLLMPSSMPHAGMEENLAVLQQLDRRVAAIPEVETVVGKLGRAETALDPAPASMYENVIQYKPEYAQDAEGHRQRFAVDAEGRYVLRSGDTLSRQQILARTIPATDSLRPDPEGQYFRNWRDHIHSPEDIWQEIVKAARLPGITSAPKLQPIETRLVMLQTGMRSSMGVKVRGPDLATIEAFSSQVEAFLKTVPGIQPATVFAERVMGKPYLLIDIDRAAIARYGFRVEDVQRSIELAIGGQSLAHVQRGRERYAIRIRYPRELRQHPEDIRRILLEAPGGEQVPLGQLAELRYERGPQSIKSEETFLVNYITFGKQAGRADGEVVNAAQDSLNRAIQRGQLQVPAGVSYHFAGRFEDQQRANRRLMFALPVTLAIIFLILYFQFRSAGTSLLVFSGILVAFGGGFWLLWLYGQAWFLDVNLFGANLQDLFQISPINLSVAVWVGFIALFGIATDDGVLMMTYLNQHFRALSRNPGNNAIREAVIEAASRRVRPALMTTATTLIALLPILSARGTGANLMLAMSIPIAGGMLISVLSIFIVPVLYEWRALRQSDSS